MIHRKLTQGFAILLALIFSFVCAGSLWAAPIGYSVIGTDTGEQLHAIDLATGVATPIGLVGFDDVDSLAFQPGTLVLFGIDEEDDQLVTINLNTGAATAVGGGFAVDAQDGGITFGSNASVIYWNDEVDDLFYTVNPNTGVETLVGPGNDATGLTFFNGVVYGVTDDDPNFLVTIDVSTGTATDVGNTGVDIADGGLAVDTATGIMYMLDGGTGNIYTVNIGTGATSLVASVSCVGSTTCEDLDSLAIPPATAARPVPSMNMWGMAIALLLFAGIVAYRSKARG